MLLAIPSKQLAATMTQLIFASLATQVARDLANSPISPASLIRAVLLTSVARSSSASFRSFHLDDLRFVWKPFGSLGMISSGSANARGSGGASSSLFGSVELQKKV